MPKSFEDRKAKILADLSTPDSEYQDLSPKGSVDEGIRELIANINGLPEYVTTSSCAGRVAAYLEGSKGAKGGGQWLFTSHDPVDLSQDVEVGSVHKRFGLVASSDDVPVDAAEARFVHFKFEPMILHILTSTPSSASHAASAALQAGFRESGISPTSIVAVRSSGLAFDCLIGYQDGDGSEIKAMVSENYLRTLVGVANQRFAMNRERTERFRKAMMRL